MIPRKAVGSRVRAWEPGGMWVRHGLGTIIAIHPDTGRGERADVDWDTGSRTIDHPLHALEPEDGYQPDPTPRQPQPASWPPKPELRAPQVLWEPYLSDADGRL